MSQRGTGLVGESTCMHMYSGIVGNTISIIHVVVHNENTWFGAQNTCVGTQYHVYMPEKCLRGDFRESKKIFL